MSNSLPRRGYWPLVAVATLLVVWFWVLVPGNLLADHWRACLLAAICGTSVGFAELASRYRDEPLHACFSPFGLVYVLINAALSLP